MSIFSKILKIVTPFDRTYMTIQIDEKHLLLPARNAAVCFLQRDDLFNLNYSDSSTMCFLDYDLIESEESYNEDFKAFMTYLKERDFKGKESMFIVTGRLVRNNSIIIYLNKHDNERYI